MKKLISSGLSGFFILGLLVVPGSSQNADEILEKIIKAQGGREVLESFKDSTTVADMELIQMGIKDRYKTVCRQTLKGIVSQHFQGVDVPIVESIGKQVDVVSRGDFIKHVSGDSVNLSRHTL